MKTTIVRFWCWLLGHRWIDAYGQVIESGAYCDRCNRLIASQMDDSDDVETLV